MTAGQAALIGRAAELARLDELLATPDEHGHVLVVLGDPGMGKSALLSQASGRGKAAGMRVLEAAGRESEQDLAFAGLHQLLLPKLDRLAELPARQADAIRGAFGLTQDPVPPDALLTGIAVLTLLSMIADDAPLLLIVDDAQWLDTASLGTLAFVARRLASEPITLLAGARGSIPPTGFDRDIPVMALQPLSLPEAGRLLQAQPHSPRGRARELVLAQAVGNPLALIELTKAVAADQDAGRHWEAEVLPLTNVLTGVLAARYAALPDDTRRALLLTAAADSPDRTVPGLSAEVLAPAELAGLIRLDQRGAHFSHPLVRSAVYHAAPFAERAAAHRTIAAALLEEPDRRAWHLAAASLGTDENVAALLEASAARTQRRGGAAAAARALERSAELSVSGQDKARRLLGAAGLALSAGQSDWVRELAGKALTLTSDQDARITARLNIGWSLLWSNRNSEALDTLLAVAAETLSYRPAIAWDALALAATVAHQTALAEERAKVRAVLNLLEGTAARPEELAQIEEYRLWIGACIGSFSDRPEAATQLRLVADRPLREPSMVGGAAWILDETEIAIKVLRTELDRLRAPGVRGASGATLSVLEWAYIDSGRWDEALAAAREAADIASAYKMETVAGSADLTAATIAAMRGDHDQVPPLLQQVLTTLDVSEYGGFAARAWHAAGLDALARGSYQTAYTQLSKHFKVNGVPLHHNFSYLAIADFAAAAARAGKQEEAAALLEQVLARMDFTPGPRFEQLAARARGLLADPADAEIHFVAGLSDPAGARWPFDRAQLQVDYGQWLRRQRRINDAKPFFVAALDTLVLLGAAPWVWRAEGELRACGISVHTPSASPGILSRLTAQQREIVTLAASGLTNAEIADRLYLSPRTVASHLYRSFPKLGISNRNQLRNLIDGSPP
ncbi:AAA family ATPase [Nonomuraea sp. NPDC001699]